MYRRTLHLFAVISFVLFGLLASSSVAAARSCWEQTTVKCCQQVGAALTVACEADGLTWSCPAKAITNPVINTVRAAVNGREGAKADGEAHCSFKKPKCGNRYQECGHQSLETKLVCEGKVVHGGTCQTSSELLSGGDGSWDLNFALAVDGQPFQFNLGGTTCGGDAEGTDLVPGPQ